MSSADADNQRKESLMSELNALFAPPTIESFGKKGLVGIPSARRAKRQNPPTSQPDPYSLSSIANAKSNGVEATSPHREDPSWRKPRPNCHDFCDSCNCTEGDRLVCDRCPASFHLECLDPPLEANEAPTGVWYCHRCTMLSKDEEEISSVSSGRSIETGSSKQIKRPASEKSGSNGSSSSAPPRRLFTARGLHGWLASSSKRVSTNDLAGWLSTGRRTSTPGEGDLRNSPLSALWDVIHYARFQNPKEFELPKDLIPGIKIPGSYKTLAERKAKPIIDLENGQIPKPIRRCYACARTCFNAPMVPCDYCSACFHLECLDPPLSQFPSRSDRWMCPLHAEHVVDKCMVRTIRLSERIRMWNELATFKSKDGMQQEQQRNELDGATHDFHMGPEDEANAITELMRTIRRGRLEADTARNAYLAIADSAKLLEGKRHTSDCVMRIAVPAAVKALYARPVQRLPRLEECRPVYEEKATEDVKIPSTCATEVADYELFVRGLLEFHLRPTGEREQSTGEQNSSLDDACSDLVAPTLPKVHGEETDVETKVSTESPLEAFPVGKSSKMARRSALVGKLKEVLAELENSDGDLKEHEDEVDLVNCDKRLLVLLARRKLDQEQLRQRNHLEVTHNGNDATDQGIDCQWTPLLKPHCDLPCRAVLLPCMGTIGPNVPMTYRQLLVGSGPDCHLRLTNYRPSSQSSQSCPYISPLHAYIFYDEFTGHFELLNYSEFGCRVDSIPFVNETVDNPARKIMTSDLVCRVRKLVKDVSADKQKPDKLSSPDKSSCKRLKMAARRFPRYDERHRLPGCSCTSLEPGNSSEEGWEGSAVLHHGSVLQFGCYNFVFSLVDTSFRPASMSPSPLPSLQSAAQPCCEGEQTATISPAEEVFSDDCVSMAES